MKHGPERPCGAARRIALAADMMFAAKIRGAAQAAGVEVILARSPSDLLERVRSAPGAHVLLDLETGQLDITETVTALRSAGARVVAFVSHVRSDLIAEARAAGAERVLARSAFVRELPVLLG